MQIRSRIAAAALLTAVTLFGAESKTPTATSNKSSVTFNKDVFPILQENCQECHRPGGIAPMSLLTYESARPWARAIRAAVVSRQMPPWFADPRYGEFRNAPKLTEENRNTLVAWVDGGAREGDAVDTPTASSKWSDGWRTQPDVIVSMPTPFQVAAKGSGDIQNFLIQNPFKEDTWVSSIEIRPGDPSVVHHVIVQVSKPAQFPPLNTIASIAPSSVPKAVSEPCGDCLLDLPDNEDDLLKYLTALALQKGSSGFAVDGFATESLCSANGSYQGGLSASRTREQQTGQGAFTTMEAIYAPGSQPMNFAYPDTAKLIPAGGSICIQVHYTPNGQATTDKTMIGFTVAKSVPHRQFVIMAPEHIVDTRKFIPPGDTNWETKGELTFEQDADLVWFMPHMHLRGKDMTFRLIQPDGSEQTVLHATFNFNWQLSYELAEPIKVSKGTRMIVTAHHDNSANNRLNPDPRMNVAWGEMTSNEMMLPWFGVVVDRDAKPETIARYKPGNLD